jgi:uncharacterized protein YbjT (DUF2867 family)
LVVLLTGASGFIGRHLMHALVASGHRVVCALRDPAAADVACERAVAVDFTRDFDTEAWLPRLAGIDVVINAVGIIREHGKQTFGAIHARVPCALFAACAASNVRLVIQISALGADANARSRYHLSKKSADDFLASLPVHSVIVQPSVVFGPGGGSARMFTMLASLPLIGLPGNGGQQMQPVHVDDVAEAVVALLARPLPSGSRLPVVGPKPISLRNYLQSLRHALGLGRAFFIPISMRAMRLAAAAGKRLPGSLLEPETLQMLERGNTADAAPLTALLGHAPRSIQEFVVDPQTAWLSAKLDWLLPLLRISIALVWIVTGIVSLGLYPVSDSYALLARVGVTGMLAPIMLYGAALLDLGFGIATLVMKKRRLLWLAQIAVIVFYTVIISWRLPEFWLHPYGPLLKNLPMIAAIWLLLELEER